MTMRRAHCRRTALAAVALLCCTLTACAPRPWEEAIDERATAKVAALLNRTSQAHPEFPGVLMRTVTPFPWDRLFAFRPGATGRDVRARTGFTFMPDRKVLDEDNYLLVFARGTTLAKVVRLAFNTDHPLDYEGGKEYPADSYLVDPEGDGILRLREPSEFRRLFDTAARDSLVEKVDGLDNGDHVAIGDLGFSWDHMRVIEPSDLKKKTGISYPKDVYQPFDNGLMVFTSEGRTVRIVEMRDLDFRKEDRVPWHGRSWSSRVQIAQDDHGRLDLREP
ncbi:hypothetical protein [Actinomadura napierensis]|uniref:Lipoprotein n=1 Tax=Actinomadura napierensis TaxID=267854 RepID=A0ABN3A4K4_9ACTN